MEQLIQFSINVAHLIGFFFGIWALLWSSLPAVAWYRKEGFTGADVMSWLMLATPGYIGVGLCICWISAFS